MPEDLRAATLADARRFAAVVQALEVIAELMVRGDVGGGERMRLQRLIAESGTAAPFLGTVLRTNETIRVQRWEWEKRARSLARQLQERDARADQGALPL